MPTINSKGKSDRLIAWLRQYAPLHIDSQLAEEQCLYPPHVWADLGAQGFFGMHISEKYGGLELSTSDMLRVIEQIAAIDLTLSIILIEAVQGAHTVEKYATESMKNKYLPLMAEGRIFTSGAMTESDAGSNPRAMKSYAVSDRKEGWLVNGSKRWVGMGVCAKLIAIYVQQFDEKGNWQGMSGFLVTGGAEGLCIGPDTPTLGMRGFPKNTIFMKNLKVNAENLLGQAGEGMEIAQDNMMYIRLCLAAASVGAMKRCVQLMYRYAERRHIATGTLLENPVTLAHIGQSTSMIDALECFISFIGRLYDQSPDLVPEEALVVAKIMGSECLGKVADRSLQLLGARGYEEACEVSKIFRDARAFRIFEGPTEALNMYLGARVLDHDERFEKFVSIMPEQKKLFNEIKKDINKIKERIITANSLPQLSAFSGSYLAQSLAGDMLTCGLLLACLHHSRKKQDADDLNPMLVWAKNRYDEAVQNALSISSGSIPIASPDDLKTAVGKYAETIGCIDQTRSGTNRAVDRLLQPELLSELEESGQPGHHHFFAKKTPSDIHIMDHHSIFQNGHGGQLKFNLNGTLTMKQYLPLGAHQIFEKKAEQAPQEIAVIYKGQKITYGELDKKSDQVARFLKEKTAGSEKVVALYFERSIEQIIGLLGILKSGCAYLPMDVNYPESQLKFMLEDSGASLVLSSKTLANDFPFDSVKTVFLEQALASPASGAKHAASMDTDLDSTGYIIYTSGSSGQPKGVILPHRALTNLIQWHLEHISGKRNVLQFTTINFDMSFIEIFGALCSGGTLVLLHEEDRLSVDKLAGTVEDFQVEQLVLSVPYLKMMADSRIDKHKLAKVKEVIIAGEQLIVTPAIRAFFSQLPGCELHNYYGPSETHVVTAYNFPKQPMDWPDYPPIGRAIPNAGIYVLDEQMKLVSGDAIGEICIGGACLARGYRNRHELTMEKFVPNPISGKAEDILYRTGDLGRYLPDGNLLYLGRKDEQVKIRGYRIEPQEIEWHLMKYPGIKEAVVIPKRNTHTDRHLEAYLVLDGLAQENFANEVFSFLREQLPPHMVPSVFNIIKSVPLTNSGKVDRHALERLEGEVVYELNDVADPVTETEKTMIDIIESVFKIRVGANHSFYSIGGNSLLAMHVLAKLKERFAVEIPAHSILSDPSIAHTAERIDSMLKDQ